jgi:2-polyprenyl-3-methyl-5-hydroxy-6-metoxy-1,4-benzoquinol methylase
MGNKLFELQDEMYDYPYHYIPHFKDKDTLLRTRTLGWALEYFSYLQVISEWVSESVNSSILDVGCGDGRFINMLASRLPESYMLGIDISEKAISFAQSFRVNENAQFKVENIESLTGKYDIVTLIEVLEHIPDDYEDSFLQEVYKRVNQGGDLIISVPSKNRPLQEKHYRHYNREYFDSLLMNNNIKYQNITYRYVFKKDIYYKLYNKLTNNDYFLFESYWLDKKIWKHVKNSLLNLDSKEGLHLIARIEL